MFAPDRSTYLGEEETAVGGSGLHTKPIGSVRTLVVMVSSRQAVVVALTALCTIFIVSRGHEQNFEPLSNLCLLCICEATSNCSKDSLAASCDEGDDTCGLYALTQAYWEDAGKLKVPDNPHESEEQNSTKLPFRQWNKVEEDTISEEIYPHSCGGKMENNLGKTTFRTHDWDLDPKLLGHRETILLQLISTFPNVGYVNPQEYVPGSLGVRENIRIMAERATSASSVRYKISQGENLNFARKNLAALRLLYRTT
uniref:lysozyme n=1 Tax=Timema shepardi TaxID=629360 RepID=A0A7R9FXZ9_TIMSH|nr:unnamed protein product [Timema shepardi]